MSTDYMGAGPVTIFPKPAGFLGEGTNPGHEDTEEDTEERPLDPRVKWSDRNFAKLRGARQEITSQMKRNRDLYANDHWAVFGSGRRPPWKLKSVVNYCRYVADRRAAVLTDNKPKTTYASVRLEDAWMAEIMSAAFNEFYEDENLQEKFEDLVKLAEVDKIAWLHPHYDPLKGHNGAIRCKVIPGMAVYVNKEATGVDDATHLCYEYTMPWGECVTRWRHLRGKKLIRVDGSEPSDHTADEREQPATSFTDPSSGQTSHAAPYAAPPSDREPSYSDRVLIREWWTRPYGPNFETDVEEIVFTVSGEIDTKRKMIQLEDGTIEPLCTVITEGNIVYELPMSTAIMLQWAETVGGLKVLSVEDSLEVTTRTVTVPLYPYGRRMVVAGREVADDGANPRADGSWPFIPYRANRDGRTLYADNNIDTIASLQDALNRIVGMIFDAANLMGNPIWRLPLNSDVPDEMLTNAPGAIVREDPLSLRLGKREAGIEIPTFVMQYVEFLIARIKELTNTSDIAAGQGKFKGQQAAETVNMYQEAAGIGNRPAMRELERAIVELGNQFRGLVVQFYSDQRVARYKDEMGIEHHRNYVGSYLSGEMTMHAKAGSGLPQSPSARLQIVTQLLNTPAMDIPELLRNLEEVGVIESASAHLKRLMQEKNNPMLTWLIPALLGPPPGGRKKTGKPNAGRSARAKSAGGIALRA